MLTLGFLYLNLTEAMFNADTEIMFDPDMAYEIVVNVKNQLLTLSFECWEGDIMSLCD